MAAKPSPPTHVRIRPETHHRLAVAAERFRMPMAGVLEMLAEYFDQLPPEQQRAFVDRQKATPPPVAST